MCVEEGDPCPSCKVGTIVVPPTKNCSCHISAPCHACVSVKLTCNQCGWEDDESES